MTEPAILQAMREVLETELPPEGAARLFAVALGEWGTRVPVSAEELRDFLGGPLASALGGALPASRALRVVRSLDSLIDTAELTTSEHAVPADPLGDEGESTQQTPIAVGEPVPVLIASGGRSMALRLSALLGETALLVQRAAEADIAVVLARLPLVVVVDASDVPSVTPERILDMIQQRTPGALLVLWGPELPFGRHLADLAARRGRELSAIPGAEGVATLADLIRARRG